MKTYQRITHYNGYDNITTVTDTDAYHQVNVWPDGFQNGEYTTTVQAMGWKSAKEFLAHKKGFELVREEATA